MASAKASRGIDLSRRGAPLHFHAGHAMGQKRQGGLEGVVAARTSLGRIDGEAGRLWIRGVDIDALAAEASYAEALYLLWYDALPSRPELAAFEGLLARERPLPEAGRRLLRALPRGLAPLTVLRTVVSAAATDPSGPAPEDRSPEAELRRATRIVARLPTALAAFHRLRSGEDPIPPDPELSHAANFLFMLRGERPRASEAEALDASLVLYLEHGLNASTFTCRVVASTLADLPACVTAAIAALGGSLHGGANRAAMEMLEEVGAPERADAWVEEALEAGRRVMGFGHRVYRVEDPRSRQLRRLAAALADESGDDRWVRLATAVEAAVRERRDLYPNVDYWCAVVYRALGLPPDLYTPLFALGRAGGWTAHAMEQLADNRLIRPRSEYVGPESRAWVPLERR